MSHRSGVTRISRKAFYDLGGFNNPALFRRQHKGGTWCYYHDPSKTSKHVDLDIDLGRESDLKRAKPRDNRSEWVANDQHVINRGWSGRL